MVKDVIHLDGLLELYDLATGRKVHALEGHDRSVVSEAGHLTARRSSPRTTAATYVFGTWEPGNNCGLTGRGEQIVSGCRRTVRHWLRPATSLSFGTSPLATGCCTLATDTRARSLPWHSGPTARPWSPVLTAKAPCVSEESRKGNNCGCSSRGRTDLCPRRPLPPRRQRRNFRGQR